VKKSSEIEIKEITENRGHVCNDLLRSLPLWFGIEAAIRQYVLDVERMPTLVAFEGELPVGFVSLNSHSEWTAEVHVMAIHPRCHRKGIGKALIEACERYLKERGYEFLSVKTISPSSANKEYALTRKFNLAMGFRPVEEFKNLWGEGNPCLLMIKSL
jgi:ribosomal protein S18 acetylase RimI-like enzyme